MIDRYRNIIEAALEIMQKRDEIKELVCKFESNITIDESKNGISDKVSANDALKLIDGLSFERNAHVKYKAIYKDLNISLHCVPENEPACVMNKILSEMKEM